MWHAVVGPARGAVGELVVGSGGGLAFTAGSSSALGHALRTLLALEPEARRAVGNSGRAHILRHFTWDRVGARLADAYGAVLESRGRPNGFAAPSVAVDAAVLDESGEPQRRAS